MFDVILSPEAQEFYADADRALAGKLARCFEQLEREPLRHVNVKRLKGSLAGLMRYRVGDWRVGYRVEVASKRGVVLLIAHRRDIYE